jgi:two-component system response regulator AtoC
MERAFMLESLKTEPSHYKILVVDDEELIRNLVINVLSEMGHSWITAIDGVDALQKMGENKFDAVITDITMPNMDGIILTREISKQYPAIPVMVMIAFDEEYAMGTAISVGAREFIKKPFSLDEFAIRLHKMIHDVETLMRPKSEKDAEESVQELVGELEKAIKKK